LLHFNLLSQLHDISLESFNLAIFYMQLPVAFTQLVAIVELSWKQAVGCLRIREWKK
jgi:hypothetical protein